MVTDCGHARTRRWIATGSRPAFLSSSSSRIRVWTGFDCFFLIKKQILSFPARRTTAPEILSITSQYDLVMATLKLQGDNATGAGQGASVQLDAAVFGAAVQLPTFDKIEPEAWFAVADANFALRKVTDPLTKYYYVLSKLDSSTLRQLSAFLKRPRLEDPYQEIRDTLCATFEPSLEQKLDALLTTTDCGDARPMEFGLELQRLLGEATTDDILERIFLRSIQPAIVTAITGSLGCKFSVLLQAAERASKAAVPTQRTALPAAAVSAVSSTPATAGTSRRGGRGGRQRGSRSGGQTKSVQLCHFHLRFGDAAKRCTPACSR